MRQIPRWFFLAAMVMAMLGCGGGGTAGPSQGDVSPAPVGETGTLQIVLPAGTGSKAPSAKSLAAATELNFLVELPKHVTKLNVTLSVVKNSVSTFYGNYPLNIVNGVCDPIPNLPVGTYTIGMDCTNFNNNVLYYGDGDGTANVAAGTTTDALVNLHIKDTILVPFVVTGVLGSFDKSPVMYKVSAVGKSSTNQADNFASTDENAYFDNNGALHFKAALRMYYTTQNDILFFTITDKGGQVIKHEGGVNIYNVLDGLDTGSATTLPYTQYVPPGALNLIVQFPTQ